MIDCTWKTDGSPGCESFEVSAPQADRYTKINVTAKQENDFVSDVDRMAEAEIIRAIHRVYPDHGILAEESGTSGGEENQWIIDPLDGTTNFVHKFPFVCVCIGLAIDKKVRSSHQMSVLAFCEAGPCLQLHKQCASYHCSWPATGASRMLSIRSIS